MKLLTFLISISCSAQVLPMGARNAFGSGSYLHSRAITIDHTKVGATDYTGPVLFRSHVGTVNTTTTAVAWASGDQFSSWMDAIDIAGTTYTFTYISAIAGTLGVSAGTQTGAAYTDTPYLKTAGNGGTLTSASGYDMAMGTTAACTVLYPFQRVSWSATTGAVEIWYSGVTVSKTVDTVVYQCYQNAGVTTDQATPTAVWDSDYLMVQHMGSPTSLSATDSTSNALNGTVTGAVAIAGQIGGAASMSSSGDQISEGTALNAAGKAFDSSTAPFTMSLWLYLSGTNQQNIFGSNPTNSSRTIEYGNAGCTASTKIGIIEGNVACIGSVTYNTLLNGWHYVVWTFAGGATNTQYVDGSPTAGTSRAFNGAYAGNTVLGGNSGGNQFNGRVDEARVSKIARSADWITAEYNNQLSPFTFFSVGAQT